MRTSSFLVALILASSVLALAPARSSAQVTEPESQAAMKQARQHFSLAESYKQRGDHHADRGETSAAHEAYGQAIEHYSEAFRLYPNADLLFNIAQMHRLRGEHSLAIEQYERYLALAPEGDGTGEARQAVEELRQAQAGAARPAPDRKPPADTSGAGDAKAGDPSEREPAKKPPVTDPLERPERAPAPARAGWAKPLRYAGVTAALVGLAVVSAGAKFGLDAREASQELSNPGDGWEQHHIGLYEKGHRDERRMFVMVGVGSAVAVSGLGLYYWGRRMTRREMASDETTTLSVTPGAGLSGLSVSLTSRF